MPKKKDLEAYCTWTSIKIWSRCVCSYWTDLNLIPKFCSSLPHSRYVMLAKVLQFR